MNVEKKEDQQEDKTHWLKRHVDTITILAAILTSFLWMNGKFNEIEKDITVIKTVLIWRLM